MAATMAEVIKVARKPIQAMTDERVALTNKRKCRF